MSNFIVLGDNLINTKKIINVHKKDNFLHIKLDDNKYLSINYSSDKECQESYIRLLNFIGAVLL